MIRRLLFVLLLTQVNAGVFCQSKNIPYVIMVSFDGFRYDYADRFDLPFFKSIQQKGAFSEGLIPSFPSKTFPNHYSLVTGLYPGNHGLVDNYFFDPGNSKEYGMRNRAAVVNPSFYGGVPLWKLCMQNGIKSAAYFWVGSEVTDSTSRPDYYYNYDQSVPFEKRTAQVIDWLNLPEEQRPHFISLYFSSPDKEGHDFGPLASQTRAAVKQLDSLMQVLVHEINKTKLAVDLIFVSDHGMVGLKHTLSTYIFIDEYVAGDKKIKVVNGGTQAHIYTADTLQRDSLYSVLKSAGGNFSVYRRDEFPEHWHYNTPQAGDILLVANPGHYIASGSREKTMKEWKEGAEFGVHGYDPAEVHEMYGIFYAIGPHIKPHSTLPPIENVHLYPLVAKIFGIKPPEKIDGKLSVVQPILK